jgi:putative membrane protein
MSGSPRQRLGLVLLLVTLLPVAGVASGTSGVTSDRLREQKILSRMHRINRMEIAMAEMAIERGQSEAVKDFARTLRKDHQENDVEVIAVARQEGLSLTLATPTRTDQRLEEHEQQTRQLLESAQGAAFDGVFLKTTAKGYGKIALLLTIARDRLPKGRVRALVTFTIPIVKRHRRIAEELQSQG